MQVLCDLDEPRARKVAQEFQIPRVVTDIHELYRNDELDVIDLCTPSYLHWKRRSTRSRPTNMSLVKNRLQDHKAVGMNCCRRSRIRKAGHAHFFSVALDTVCKNSSPCANRHRGRAYSDHLGDFMAAAASRLLRQHMARQMERRNWWRALVTLAIHAQDTVQYILGPAESIGAPLQPSSTG